MLLKSCVHYWQLLQCFTLVKVMMSWFVSVNTLDLHYKQAGTVTPLYSTVCNTFAFFDIHWSDVLYKQFSWATAGTHLWRTPRRRHFFFFFFYSGVCYVHSLFLHLTYTCRANTDKWKNIISRQVNEPVRLNSSSCKVLEKHSRPCN